VPKETDAAPGYGWQSATPTCSDEYVTPCILQTLKSLQAQRVADLGAGNGTLCMRLAQQGLQVVGVEYDAQGVAIARRAHPDIPFYNFGVQDDPSRLLAEEERFDVVVSTEVIEHLFSPHQLPQYAAGILKPGGYLVVSTPYHGYLKNLVLSLLDKWDHHHTALWHGGHIKFWSRRTLGRLLEDNGFRTLSFTGVGRFPFLWKSMVMVAQRAD
jgi:2-polyprenyl-3-methyl-5-hydroxy-6-metoxy-1,4-benzoquinol methylase